MKICFVAIGSELLKGRIVNSNMTKVGEMLRQNGFDLSRAMEIQDHQEAIISMLEEEIERNDVILMSGGLGPTSDDITKKTLAHFFGVGMTEHIPTSEKIAAFFEKRGLPFSERNRQQAFVPDNCEVLMNLKGTAPGMYFQINGKIVISMPGVPFEMLYLMEQEVIPILKKTQQEIYFHHHILRIWGIPESFLADKIATIEENAIPEIDISYLPRMDGIWLELTVRGAKNAQQTWDDALASAVDALKKKLSKEVYAEGKKDLAEMIQEKFLEKRMTLAIAESMTGGQITAKLITISGASQYLKGGITAYFTEIKEALLNVPHDIIEKEGVVSAAVAEAMAQQVRLLFHADIGLATTGYAAPPATGVSPHIWIAYADPTHTVSHRETFLNDRAINIQRGVEAALVFLLRQLNVPLV